MKLWLLTRYTWGDLRDNEGFTELRGIFTSKEEAEKYVDEMGRWGVKIEEIEADKIHYENLI